MSICPWDTFNVVKMNHLKVSIILKVLKLVFFFFSPPCKRCLGSAGWTKSRTLCNNNINSQRQYSQTSIYVLLYLRTFNLRTVFFFFFFLENITLNTYSNLIHVLHLTYSNLIYALSKVRILNTGVRISKYKGPIELHGDFGESVQQDWNCP